jgi:hypothetical protein
MHFNIFDNIKPFSCQILPVIAGFRCFVLRSTPIDKTKPLFFRMYQLNPIKEMLS